MRNSVAATVPSPPLASSSGLGLKDLRRLQLLYPQRHQLRTERHATHFNADLPRSL